MKPLNVYKIVVSHYKSTSQQKCCFRQHKYTVLYVSFVYDHTASELTTGWCSIQDADHKFGKPKFKTI